MNPHQGVPVNADGRAIGDAHHRTVWPDALVRRVRDLHDGIEHAHVEVAGRLGPRRLHKLLADEGVHVPFETLRDILYCKRREVPAEIRAPRSESERASLERMRQEHDDESE